MHIQVDAVLACTGESSGNPRARIMASPVPGKRLRDDMEEEANGTHQDGILAQKDGKLTVESYEPCLQLGTFSRID